MYNKDYQCHNCVSIISANFSCHKPNKLRTNVKVNVKLTYLQRITKTFKMSWGTELWDRYDAMCTFTSSGVDFLDTSVAQFMKARSVIESEYAKKLRKLVKDYTPKDSQNDSASGNLKPSDGKPTRSGSRAGTLQRNKSKNRDDSSKSGPASLGGRRRPAKGDEYSHMSAYKQVRLSTVI